MAAQTRSPIMACQDGRDSAGRCSILVVDDDPNLREVIADMLEGVLPGQKLGRTWRVRREDLEGFIARGRMRGARR